MNAHGALPPMPDRYTGEPRPPHPDTYRWKVTTRPPWNPYRVPQPPEAAGAVLEWHYESRKAQFGGFVFALVILGIPIFFTLGGFDGTSSWWLWLIGVGIFVLFCIGTRGKRYSAGADWFMIGKHLVDTYGLISIEYKPRSTRGQTRSPAQVILRDQHGNGIWVDLDDLQEKPDMWALVYNGIRHSVVSGAQVDHGTIDGLCLHDVVRMRDQHRQGRRSDDRPG